MFFRQVLYRDLGCASYVLGDGGEAVVVDPRWDIEVYLEIAATERLRITHVIDTHDHADHVSGRRRLAEATGARARRAADADDDSAERIQVGDRITVGSLTLTAMAAPGHRPEHLAYAVADQSRGSEPWMLLSGDSLLVGDIARPDLAVTADEGARALHGSLRRLLALGDHVELWPAHVGGSLCGGAGLSGKTSSTLGYERRHNPLLAMDEPEFVAGLTASLPSRPPNVERVVALNRHDGLSPAAPRVLDPAGLRAHVQAGMTVLDSRIPARFDDGHIVGSINLPVSSPGVGTRAGWALEPDRPLVVIAGEQAEAERMVSALHAVGFWVIKGVSIADPEAWRAEDIPVQRAGSWDVEQLADGLRADRVELVDVREPAEWRAGHVAGSHHVPLHRLRDVESIVLPQRGRTTAVACAAGIRAAFAASILRRVGRRDVVRVADGGVGDLPGFGLELALGADGS